MTSSASPDTARAARPALRLRAPLIGRTHELALLEDALFDTLGNRTPHTLAILGGAGVGKSRLCREFLADMRIRHPELRVLAGQCRQGGERYGVMRALLRNRLGLVEGMAPEAAASTLREIVGEVLGDRRVGELVQFLGAFLDLGLPDSQLVQAISDDAEQMRQLSRSVLRRFLEADATRQPLVIALDDFHLAHADAASLVHYLARSLTAAPILFVVVARPELFDRHPEWLEMGGEAVRFDLRPLDDADAATMIEQLLLPFGAAPAELARLCDETIERAGGNPFVIEQIMRTFVERGVVSAHPDGAMRIDLARMAQVELPLTVDDAIQARIAGLGSEERNLLEMAASMGGVFWLGALVALERGAGVPPRLWSEKHADRKRIAASLDELVERDYLLRLPDASIAGETEYAFKHNLEREALQRYTSKQLLAHHHRVIAQWLERNQGEGSEEQHELVAQHFDLGCVPERAAHHYLAAAERARVRYASARAVEYYRRGLALLGEGKGLARLQALEGFGDALETCGQRDHALAVFEQLRVLAYQLDMGSQAASAHAHIGRLHRDLGQLSDALDHLDAAQALFESAGDVPGGASTLETLASIQRLKGNFAAAEHLLREAVENAESRKDDRALARALIGQGSIDRERLQLTAAEDTLGRALGIARRIGDDAATGDALVQLGATRAHGADTEHALSLWQEALSLAQQTSDRHRQVAARVAIGACAYRTGAYAQALAELTQAAALAGPLGNRLVEADVLRSLAKARAFTGDLSGAMADGLRAIAIFDGAGARPQLGVALRSYAEIASASPAHDVVSFFERACAIFAELAADLELARASLGLAEYLGRGSAEAADGRDRALRAEGLRTHARQLIDRHAGITIRASLVPRRA